MSFDAPSAPEYRDSEYVARRLGRSVKWVQRETKAGRLPASRIGRHYRYTDDGIDQYVQGHALDDDGPVR